MESARLDKEIGPLLTSESRSTLYEGGNCDSDPEGGVFVSYDLDPDASVREFVRKFRAAGWIDLPKGEPGCARDCVLRVGKSVDDRRIELTVHDYSNGSRILEAYFSG